MIGLVKTLFHCLPGPLESPARPGHILTQFRPDAMNESVDTMSPTKMRIMRVISLYSFITISWSHSMLFVCFGLKDYVGGGDLSGQISWMNGGITSETSENRALRAEPWRR